MLDADAVATLEQCKQVLGHNPENAGAWFNLAIACYALHLEGPMERALSQAFTLEPNNPEFHYKLGLLCKEQMNFARAIASLQRADALRPGTLEIPLALAEACQHQGDVDAACRLYQQLSSDFPHAVTPRLELAYAFPHIPSSNADIDASRAHVMANFDRLMAEGFTFDAPEKQLRNLPFYQSYHGRDNKSFMLKMAEFFRHCCPSLTYTAPHCKKPPAPKKRLRIGFVSEYMHVRLLNQFYATLLISLAAREDLDIHIFAATPPADARGEDIARAAAQFTLLPPDLTAARTLLAEAELDLLIYLEIGMKPLSYFLAYARLAPVQCVMTGHPITSGISTIDYMLTARLMEPDHPEPHYSEKLICFEHMLVTFHRPEVPAHRKPRLSLALPDDATLYACPVTLFKIHPDMDAIFAKILKRDAKALIVLCDPGYALWQTQLKKRFEDAMGSALAERILFLPFLQGEDFYHLLRNVDAVLDPVHFSFGTTAYLAVAADVPFVTWPGEFMRGRVGTALYRQMDMPELLAPTHEAYVELALKLAADKQFYQAMSEKIRTRSERVFTSDGVAEEYATHIHRIYGEATL